MPTKNVSSRRPYLLRAMHDWMIDNGQTPQIVVDASRKKVDVPEQHVQDGKIVLNVSHSATGDLILGNELIEFKARFDGAEHLVCFPVSAVLGIYARETGQGMIFTDEDNMPPDNAPKPPPKRSHLKVVK